MEEHYDIEWVPMAERLPPRGVLIFFQKADGSVQMGHRTGKTWIQNGSIKEPTIRIPQEDVVAWASKWKNKHL